MNRSFMYHIVDVGVMTIVENVEFYQQDKKKSKNVEFWTVASFACLIRTKKRKGLPSFDEGF